MYENLSTWPGEGVSKNQNYFFMGGPFLDRIKKNILEGMTILYLMSLILSYFQPISIWKNTYNF